MESLITEPGAKNPLLFLSLSLVNRIPGYNPDEKETLNQLECLNDLISSLPISIFRLESVKNPVAVSVDSLMSISLAEAKKSIKIRVSALECLKLLIKKLDAAGINSLIEIIPGVLSKMIKITTGRVDVEVDRVIILSLEIIEVIVECFWREQQDEWISKESITEEQMVLLKQKYKNNIEIIVSSLRPLVKNRQRAAQFHQTLFNILSRHINSSNSTNTACIKLYLILTAHDSKASDIITKKKVLVDIYNDEIVEWFEVNSDRLNEIHEEVFVEKVGIIFGLFNLKSFQSFLLISDLFKVVKQLTELRVSIGDTVSIEYSDDGIGTLLDYNQLSTVVTVPKIIFKSKLKLSKEFHDLIEKLMEKLIQTDAKAVENLLINFEDDSIETLIQKIDLSSLYYKLSDTKNLVSLSSFKDCLKYFERSVKSGEEVEKLQMIHLATLKLLWSISESCPQVIRPNLLIILSGMTSDWMILREASTQIFKAIAKGKCKEFINENEGFLLDRLGIQLSLPAFYPEAPKIISCLVREISDPSSAMKFTDMLVKKVSNNLAMYQGYPAYCKDLLTVAEETIQTISKGKAVEFIDPKDFAFTKKDDQEDEKKIVLNCQQRIILDLLRIGINFILSDSKSIRARSVNLITCSVKNFTKYLENIKEESSDLCQLIHLAWPNIMAVLNDCKDLRKSVQLDILVIESVTSCCSLLFEKFPLFMRDRFVKDFWRLGVKKIILGIESSNSCQLQIIKLLLSTLDCGIINCKPSTEICSEILNHLIVSNNANDFENVLKSIWTLEPDIIWYFYYIELGEIDEIIAPSPELKSFKIAKTNRLTNTSQLQSLKFKLKQFIQ